MYENGTGEVDDIVKSFVDGDLANLDKIGEDDEAVSLEPTKYVVQPSPPLTSNGNSTRSSLQGPPLTSSGASHMSQRNSQNNLAGINASGSSRRRSQTGSVSSVGAGSNAPTALPQGGKRITSNTSMASGSGPSTNVEKRTSLGDKFKSFGRRVTSTSKKD